VPSWDGTERRTIHELRGLAEGGQGTRGHYIVGDLPPSFTSSFLTPSSVTPPTVFHSSPVPFASPSSNLNLKARFLRLPSLSLPYNSRTPDLQACVESRALVHEFRHHQRSDGATPAKPLLLATTEPFPICRHRSSREGPRSRPRETSTDVAVKQGSAHDSRSLDSSRRSRTVSLPDCSASTKAPSGWPR